MRELLSINFALNTVFPYFYGICGNIGDMQNDIFGATKQRQHTIKQVVIRQIGVTFFQVTHDIGK